MSLTFVQSNAVIGAAVAFSSSVGGGSYLIAFVLGSGVITVSDLINGTWENIGPASGSSVFQIPANGNASAFTVNATSVGGSISVLVVAEYSGGATVAPLDNILEQVDALNSIGPVLLDYTNETLIAIGWLTNTVNYTAGSGFTKRVSTGFGTSSNQLFEDGPFSGFGQQSATFSTGGGGTKFLLAVKSATSVYQGATFSPASGTIFAGGSQVVTISSAAPSPTIYYTTDGSTPTTASATIASGGTITLTKSAVVQAIVVSGGLTSSVSSATYTAQMNQFVDHGTVIPAVSSDSPGQPNALYESGALILTPNIDGKIFKNWFSTTNGICYAESNDGLAWTRYVSNPVVANERYARLYKNGSTYYLYSSTAPAPSSAINVRISTDGVTWTLQASGQLAPSQAWEAGGNPVQLCVCAVVAGTWYAYYTSWNNFVEGLATSTDGIHWTKFAGNPVITALTSNFQFFQVNGKYYGWDGGSPNSPLGYAYANTSRFSSPSPTGPWTQELISSLYPTIAGQTIDGTATGAQYGDPSVVEALGNVYQYASYNPANLNDGSHWVIVGAVATGKTLAQLVGTYEGVRNIPIPTQLSQNLVTLASDNFTRANGSLGANWNTAFSTYGYKSGAIVSNSAQSVASGTAISTWLGSVLPTDQWGQVTVGTTINGSNVGIALRADTTSSPNPLTNFYRFLFSGNTGTSGTVEIQKITRNNGTTTLATGTAKISTGDVLTACAIGSNLILYWNGSFLMKAVDSSFATGSVGIIVTPATNPTDASITSFSAGTFNDAPTFGSSGGGPGTIFVSRPVPVTAVNSSGHSLALAGPSVSGNNGQPTPICFTDPNGNEYTTTGSSVGSEIGAPTPVVLCNQQGRPIVPPIVFTSGSGSLSISSTLTGKKLGQPTPVVLSSSNGFLYTLSGFSYGTGAQSPTPVALCDTNGNVMTGTIAT